MQDLKCSTWVRIKSATSRKINSFSLSRTRLMVRLSILRVRYQEKASDYHLLKHQATKTMVMKNSHLMGSPKTLKKKILKTRIKWTFTMSSFNPLINLTVKLWWLTSWSPSKLLKMCLSKVQRLLLTGKSLAVSPLTIRNIKTYLLHLSLGVDLDLITRVL